MKFFAFISVLLCINICRAQNPAMNDMWKGESNAKTIDNGRGKIFREGRYAMFIHWGYFSALGNRWNGKTYYGIGEWLMNENMANIPVVEYKKDIGNFNPVNFNADSIVQLAKDAGMKYIIITSKHHDGFAMFHSRYSKFNIADATPFKRDPMKEMAAACKKGGIGLGFYYSQTQDWTTPGGYGGPKKDEHGKEVSFDDYFNNRCLPEVQQLTTEYGPIVLVWFDTPNDIKKEYAQQLVEVVHKNQPGAYVSGRVGHGLGDYSTFGDMEVPKHNVPGLWETVDVTNDSWGYAWYDENWKSPKEILTGTLSTIARGGNFMLNIGPKDDGSVLPQPAAALRSAGAWIKRYPDIVYKGGRSPWGHALAWGDATAQGNKISLLVYDWPSTGKLYVPRLQLPVISAALLANGKKQALKFTKEKDWILIDIPFRAPERLVSVIELVVKGEPAADEIVGLDPQQATVLDGLFADTKNAHKQEQHWMEKFGEWKHIDRIIQWQPGGTATWMIDVLHPGYYQASLNYTGNGRVVWKITTDEGKLVQNQQSSSSVYAYYPIGWVKFNTAGRHTISVSLEEGDAKTASLSALKLEPVVF